MARDFHQRPDLNRSVWRERDLRGPIECRVEVGNVDHVEATQYLLRLGEGSIGGDNVAVADPDGGRSIRTL